MNFECVRSYQCEKILHQIVEDHIWECYWEQIRMGGSKLWIQGAKFKMHVSCTTRYMGVSSLIHIVDISLVLCKFYFSMQRTPNDVCFDLCSRKTTSLQHQDSEHHNKWLTTQMGLRPSQHLLVLPSVQSDDIVCFGDQFANGEKSLHLSFRHFCLKLVCRAKCNQRLHHVENVIEKGTDYQHC